jgi:hypothetical protein
MDQRGLGRWAIFANRAEAPTARMRGRRRSSNGSTGVTLAAEVVMVSEATDLLVDGFGRVRESVPTVLSGLTPDQAAYRPDDRANSITWLVWHLTRVLDSHLAALDGDQQVWLHDGFADRAGLALPDHDTGYGHGPEQVAEVTLEPLSLLADYHEAVQTRLTEYVASLADDDFARVVDERWDPPVTLGVRLISILDDAARHIGQAEYVRGLVDRA